MKNAFQTFDPSSGLILTQFALALISGCLTAAVAEAARLQVLYPERDLGLLAALHGQVDAALTDALRMLAEGEA